MSSIRRTAPSQQNLEIPIQAAKNYWRIMVSAEAKNLIFTHDSVKRE
jgi:hypothetical protein